jgi:hypothetical protein
MEKKRRKPGFPPLHSFHQLALTPERLVTFTGIHTHCIHSKKNEKE